MKNMPRKPTVIDLFCGCGGLSKGFENAGFEILLGVDNWPNALMSFSANHPRSEVYLADLLVEQPAKILNRFNLIGRKVDVIIGGPPCQGFSIAGKRNENDPRNKLYKSFFKFVKEIKPRAFVMENVPNILSISGGKLKEKIIREFEDLGYTVSYKILTASDYGVPQNRKRVFFVGIKGKKMFEFPESAHNGFNGKITSKDAIDDLPESGLLDGEPYIKPAASDYQKMMRVGSNGVFNHEPVLHTDETRRIISLVPDGGNYKDLPTKLQSTRRVNIAWTRLDSSKPSFTIDTGHNHHFHYKYNRVPTVRESARLQSFPDTFIFKGGKLSELRQVGNAVPPLLAKIVAKQLTKYL